MIKTNVRKNIRVPKNKGDIAIVLSLFNEHITRGLLSGSLEELERYGFNTHNVHSRGALRAPVSGRGGVLPPVSGKGTALRAPTVNIFEVPGAFEIPLVAKKLAQSKKYCGVIALGCVIRGETPHFEYVSQAAALGCLQAGLESGCPVAFGVLTVENEAQALERSRLNEFNKGREAAGALLQTLSVLESVSWEPDARPERSHSRRLSK